LNDMAAEQALEGTQTPSERKSSANWFFVHQQSTWSLRIIAAPYVVSNRRSPDGRALSTANRVLRMPAWVPPEYCL